MAGRQPIYPQTIVKGAAVNLNAGSQFSAQFPMGPGYYQLLVRLNIALTIGTGTGPVTNGELDFLRQISLRTSLGEIICNNVPARALYNAAIVRTGMVPRKDAIAAATATYRIDIPIPFSDRLVLRPEDTILNTSRYTGVTLDLLTGPLTDLLTAPGTATVVLTADLMLIRSKGAWPVEAGVIGFQQWQMAPVVDAATTTYIDLERAPDLRYKRLYIHSATGSAAGRGFYGANSDAIIDTLQFTDGDNNYVKDGIWAQMQDDNKANYGLETVPAGLIVIDLVRDKSNISALYTGDKNQLRLSWTNQGAPAVNSMVSVLAECYRDLRAAA